MPENKNIDNSDVISIYEIIVIIKTRKYLFAMMLSLFLMLGVLHGNIKQESVIKSTPARAKILMGTRVVLENEIAQVTLLETYKRFNNELRNIKGLDVIINPAKAYEISLKMKGDTYFKSYDKLTLILDSIESRHGKIFKDLRVDMNKYKTLKQSHLGNLSAMLEKSPDSIKLTSEALTIKEELIKLDAALSFTKPTIIFRDKALLQEDIDKLIRVMRLKLILLYFITGIFVSIYIILMIETRNKLRKN